ncbi:helix-turn-helix domain-containing protein [Escherichia coli]|uniref:helix-turn-helix domain-containing protein n=1 Tax=Escherichia coli TaxID=562 RepID=UPI0038B2BCDF
MTDIDFIFIWIEQNLDTRISIKSLSSIAHCSSRHLSTVFRKVTGLSPAEYIRRRRLTQASFLLRHTERSITEIALMYGYEYPQTFTRLFTSFYGQSPRSYRNADSWDMRFFCPSAIVKDIVCSPEQKYLKKINLTILRKNIYKINYGYSLLLSLAGNIHSTTYNLIHHYTDFIFTNNAYNSFYVYGKTDFKKGYDLIITSFLGRLKSDDGLSNNTFFITEGNYICFTFVGKPDDLIFNQVWAQGHGLHKYHCNLMRGPSFSYFEKTSSQDIYRCHYYLPGIIKYNS